MSDSTIKTVHQRDADSSRKEQKILGTAASTPNIVVTGDRKTLQWFTVNIHGTYERIGILVSHLDKMGLAAFFYDPSYMDEPFAELEVEPGKPCRFKWHGFIIDCSYGTYEHAFFPKNRELQVNLVFHRSG